MLGRRGTDGLVNGKCTSGCATDKAGPKNNFRSRSKCTDSEERDTASHEVKPVGLSGPKLSSTFSCSARQCKR